MPRFLGEMKDACLENLSSDPGTSIAGHVYYNTTTGQVMLDNGTSKRNLLRNDGKAVFGTSGTANSNIRLHRASTSLLQFVQGGDTTAEGTLSTALAQLSARVENTTAATKPANGNAGRLLWVTDASQLLLDTGSSYLNVGVPYTPPAAVAFEGSTSGTSGIGTGNLQTAVPFNTITVDTSSGWDATNKWYSIPSSGVYLVGMTLNFINTSPSTTLSIPADLNIYYSATSGGTFSAPITVVLADATTASKSSSGNNSMNGGTLTYMLNAVAGGRIKFVANQYSGATINISGGASGWIMKLPGT